MCLCVGCCNGHIRKLGRNGRCMERNAAINQWHTVFKHTLTHTQKLELGSIWRKPSSYWKIGMQLLWKWCGSDLENDKNWHSNAALKACNHLQRKCTHAINHSVWCLLSTHASFLLKQHRAPSVTDPEVTFESSQTPGLQVFSNLFRWTYWTKRLSNSSSHWIRKLWGQDAFSL